MLHKFLLLLYTFVLPAPNCRIAAQMQPTIQCSDNLGMCMDDQSFAIISTEFRAISPDSTERVTRGSIHQESSLVAQEQALPTAYQWDYG